MKAQIIQSIHDPVALEKLYRTDKILFTREFINLGTEFDTDLVRYWKIRLQYDAGPPGKSLLKTDIWAVTIISIMMAILVKLHLILGNTTIEDYYFRNLAVILFSGLTTWFILRNKITGIKNILILVAPVVILAIFLNLLPQQLSDTTKLAFLHAPLLMWFIFGLAWTSLKFNDTGKVLSFIRFNGELAIMTGLLCIAGGILSGMTISLFAIIGKNIGQFYMENIVIIGLVVFPVLAAWLIELYPDITRRIAPVISRIFTPLVLISAIVYLIAIIMLGISLSENRDFLIIFNLLLLGVMAIIVFSLSEIDKANIGKLNMIMLFCLAVLTLVIDLFALSAIISRLSEGFTPNRTAVLLSNILVLINLLLILPDLFLAGFKGKSTDRAEKIITAYLPVYLLYTVVVIFIFPLIF
jgi:hypothetical protein